MARRRKRAAVSDLARSCAAGGDCPPDVYNKIHDNTVADRILKWLTPFLFLGGLGIGTGRGSGGSFGYRPIGGTAARPGVTNIRPSVPVETLTPELVPVDAVGATDPSIVPLTTAEESSVVDVLPEAQPEGGPTVGSTEPAQVDVVPEEPPRKVRITKSQHPNPVFHFSYTTAETSAGDASVVELGSNSSVIGPPVLETAAESIELTTFRTSGETTGEEFTVGEAESEFTTSTPNQTRPARPTRPKFYSRRYTQVRVTDPQFLRRPITLIGIDNPAYDPEVTAEFEQELSEVATATDTDFRDVYKLSRPYYTERANTGRVRVSRFGQKASLHTRSGTRVGPALHFYYDLSSINPGESIELRTLGEASGSSTVVNATTNQELDIINLSDDIADTYIDLDTPVVDPTNAIQTLEYTDEDLLDTYEDVGEDLHLIITGSSRRRPPVSIPHFTESIGEIPGITVQFPGWTPDTEPPTVIINPSDHTPDIVLDFNTSTSTILDPSLFRIKRRKRKRALY